MDNTYTHGIGMQMGEHQNQSDEMLARLVLTDPRALVVLIKRYESRLLSYIKRISGFRNEDAEDILQEAFIDAYKNIAAFDSSLKFSSWIYRIVHNRTISAYRKIKKDLQNTSLDDEDEGIGRLISAGEETDRIAEKSLTKKMVVQILSQLPYRDRFVLVLAYMEEKTYDEISDILYAPSNTVATWIRRAKIKFKKIADSMPIASKTI